MKPANFPARKVARQVEALRRFNRVGAEHPASARKAAELNALNAAIQGGGTARDKRTKKLRGARASF